MRPCGGGAVQGPGDGAGSVAQALGGAAVLAQPLGSAPATRADDPASHVPSQCIDLQDTPSALPCFAMHLAAYVMRVHEAVIDHSKSKDHLLMLQARQQQRAAGSGGRGEDGGAGGGEPGCHARSAASRRSRWAAHA